MTLRRLWLVRHGESEANVAATRAEREGLEIIPVDERDADVVLSAVGVDQAEALRGWVDDHRDAIDSFWVSPYRRARQTLEIAMAGRGTALVDDRLRDRELGILDLHTHLGVRRRHPEEADRRRHLGKYYHRPPGGESWADVALRLRSFLRDAGERPGEAALIVAHDAVVTLLTALLVPMDEAELLDFAAAHAVANASLTHLERGTDCWHLREFASTRHLESDGARVTDHPGDPDVHPR